MPERPPLYRTRIVVVGGEEKLAYDIAKQGDDPVAVVGPNAVPCPRCQQKAGDPCVTPSSQQKVFSHFERTIAMNKELERLKAEVERELWPDRTKVKVKNDAGEWVEQ